MSTQHPTVETYSLFAGNGRYIRKATRVRFAEGQVVSFIERMPKGEAVRQAVAELERQAQ